MVGPPSDGVSMDALTAVTDENIAESYAESLANRALFAAMTELYHTVPTREQVLDKYKQFSIDIAPKVSRQLILKNVFRPFCWELMHDSLIYTFFFVFFSVIAWSW